jgi:hypothetical protein
MTDAEKDQILNAYIQAAEPLLDPVAKLDNQALDFRPAIADAWTIREHLAHFFHADMFCYTRVGIAIAEPGETLFAWKEGLWNSNIGPDFMTVKDLVAGVRTVRGFIAALARSVPASGWDSAVAVHPKRGPMKIADLLAIYTGHAAFHIEYLERNLAAMKQR